ncbi:hypothetical protein TrVE_jg7566 [Triparma verrucosa]|uniref:RRM domain-containing protein n=2 Tax=Triparma TaxID=722752 RepID=A0A9W7AZ80_9STRA|nr:hypothetical protein TrST_g7567 [Triparma strigata]GMH93944.1 hypothetical protein TrVE_jg7566 [Triparma verrucosa]
MSQKKSLYIGGLSSTATPTIIKAAFIPFGEIRDVDVPMDFKTGQNKGFCFLTYVTASDCAEALYNMDGSELLDRTLNVKYSSEDKDYNPNSEAVWKGDKWIKEHGVGGDGAEEEERKIQALKEMNGPAIN